MAPWPALLIVLWMPTARAPGNVTTQILPSGTACLVVKDAILKAIKDKIGYEGPQAFCQPLAPTD